MDEESKILVIECLKNTIWHSLDQNLIKTALFTSERLYSLDQNSPDSVYLVSLVHYRAQNYYKAAEFYTSSTIDSQNHGDNRDVNGRKSNTVKDTQRINRINQGVVSHIGCLYIYALSCLELKEYSKAIVALEKSSPLWKNLPSGTQSNASSSTSNRLVLPTAAMIHTVMGHLYKALDSDVKAIRSYALALRLDPLLWEAAESLCHYGVDLEINNIYKHLTVDVLPNKNEFENFPNANSESFSSEKPPQGFSFGKQDPNSFTGTFSSSFQDLHDPFSLNNSISTNSNQGAGMGVHSKISTMARPKSKAFAGPSSLSSIHSSRNSKSLFSRPLDDSISTPTSSNQSHHHPSASSNITESFSTPTDSSKTTLSRSSNILNAPSKRSTRVVPNSSSSLGISSSSTINSTSNNSNSSSSNSTLNGNEFQPRRSTRLAAAANASSETAKKNSITSSSKFSFSLSSSTSSSSSSGNSNANSNTGKSGLSMAPPSSVSGLKGRLSSNINGKTKSTPFSHIIGSQSSAFSLSSDNNGNLRNNNNILNDVSNTNSINNIAMPTIEQEQALDFLIQMYTQYTKVCLFFNKYDCDAAISELKKFPRSQQQTSWVLAKYARLYFEKVEYETSLKYFEQLRIVDKFRLEDMDYYSTLLWHLHMDYELSYLAYDLSNFARNKPQTWCAIGNACSLQHETDAALRCFRRASQVDPSTPYPYTLQAHEYVANDSYEHAQDSYRMALKVDKRHYNAWYGLGMVFLRLGNTSMAELHFRRAATINPVNVVLICCIGMVLEKTGRYEEALRQYTQATFMQQNSAMSRYKRARLLVRLQRFEEALEELQILEKIATDEASVYFLLGQVYKLLGEKEEAVRAFTVALNLDPKGSQMIEEALESLEYDTGTSSDLTNSQGGSNSSPNSKGRSHNHHHHHNHHRTTTTAAGDDSSGATISV